MQEVIISYFSAFNPVLIAVLIFSVIWTIIINAFRGGY